MSRLLFNIDVEMLGPQPSLLVSDQGDIEAINSSALTFLGFSSSQELTGAPLTHIIPYTIIGARDHHRFSSDHSQDQINPASFCIGRNTLFPLRTSSGALTVVRLVIMPLASSAKTHYWMMIYPIKFSAPSNREELMHQFRKYLSFFPTTHDFRTPSPDLPDEDLLLCATDILRTELQQWSALVWSRKTEAESVLVPFLMNEICTPSSSALQALRDVLSKHFKNPTKRDRAYMNLVVLRLLAPLFLGDEMLAPAMKLLIKTCYSRDNMPTLQSNPDLLANPENRSRSHSPPRMRKTPSSPAMTRKALPSLSTTLKTTSTNPSALPALNSPWSPNSARGSLPYLARASSNAEPTNSSWVSGQSTTEDLDLSASSERGSSFGPQIIIESGKEQQRLMPWLSNYSSAVGVASVTNLDDLMSHLIIEEIRHDLIFHVFKLDNTSSRLWQSQTLSWYLLSMLWQSQGIEFFQVVLAPTLAKIINNPINFAASVPKKHISFYKELVKEFLVTLNHSAALIPVRTRNLMSVNVLAANAVFPKIFSNLISNSDMYNLAPEQSKKSIEYFVKVIEAVATKKEDKYLKKFPKEVHSGFTKFVEFFAKSLSLSYVPYPNQLISQIKGQIAKDMMPQFKGMRDPFSIHQASISLYPKIWSWVRELTAVPRILTRSQKEIVAIYVSKANECPYCLQAHTVMLQVTEGKQFAQDLVKENKLDDQELSQLMTSMLEGNGPQIRAAQRKMDLEPGAMGEILGVFQLNHFFNKSSTVRLGDRMMPIPMFLFPAVRELMASDMMLGNIMKKNEHVSGQSFQFTDHIPKWVREGGATPEYLRPFLAPLPDLQRAFSQLNWEYLNLEQFHIPKNLVKFLDLQLSFWNGEQMPISSKWAQNLATQAISERDLLPEEYNLGLMVLYTAQAPTQVTQQLKDSVKRVLKSEEKYTNLISWTAWRASLRRLEIVCQYLSTD